jgi:hypothetical protein
VTRVPAVDGIGRDHKLWRPDRSSGVQTASLNDLGRKMAARVARGGGVSSCQPITRPRSAVDKLGLPSTTLRRPDRS